MVYGQNSGYGRAFFDAIFGQGPTLGKTFIVAASTDSNFQMIQQIIKEDNDGLVRLYSTITLALAACTAGEGDKILLSPGFVTAPTLTELASAATKGVAMEQLGGKTGNDYVTLRATATLPATTKTPYFTVTAPIRLLDIVGEVTTAIQAQINAVKLVATPTVGSAVDLCGTLDINGNAVGTVYTITGTLATAMASNANGVVVAQAAPIVIPAGTIDLNTAATSTGATKWAVRYLPLVPGARVFAA